MLVDDGITPNIHVTTKIFCLFYEIAPDQTVVENWHPSRKKTIQFVTSAEFSHFPGWHGVAKNDKQ